MANDKRESPNGYHYYTAYRDCMWKWYMKYIEGLKPKKTPTALIFGSAIHEALELFYDNHMTSKADDVIGKAINYLIENKNIIPYKAKEDINILKNKAEIMLSTWYREWALEDLEKFEVIEVEQSYEISLGPEENSFLFTVRPDRVLRNKSTKLYEVHDTKTTGYSIPKAYQAVEQQDQITSYIWALNLQHPKWDLDTGMVDILYRKGNVCKAERHGPIYRNKLDLIRFEMGMYGTILEVSQKVENLNKYPRETMFPRNGAICSIFDCEYKDICRTNLKPGAIPLGFKRDEWKKDKDNANN